MFDPYAKAHEIFAALPPICDPHEIHAAKLEAYGRSLTAEEATKINNNYDIELHFGIHALYTGQKYAPTLPTQREYEAAGAVVEAMEPGDVLFVENYGFRRQPLQLDGPILPAEQSSAKPEDSPGSHARRALQYALLAAEGLKQELHHSLEEARHNYKLDAWEYAKLRAELKGVQVVYADHDISDEISFRVLSKGKGLDELTAYPDTQHEALVERTHASRERKACDTVVSYALDHLPPEGTPAPHGRKPKLTLLFGRWHKPGFEQLFNELGLDVNISDMDASDMRMRKAEHAARVFGDFLVTHAVQVAAELASRRPFESARQARLEGRRERFGRRIKDTGTSDQA